MTNNTLGAANPTETNTLAQTTFTCTWDSTRVCHRLTGTVTTRSRRDFRIDGYVDTSRGRIRSSVIQSNRFTNAVTWDVTGPEVLNRDYEGAFLQKVRLASNVDRTSYRTLGNTLSSQNLARLVALIGPARARELLFTARFVEAEEGKAIGLFTEVVEPDRLEARALELAALIAGHAPLTLRSTKEGIRRILEQARLEEADDLLLLCYLSEDFREGIAAFLDKRPAQWKGR